MKSRCSNEKNTRYSDYGGRGIKVCDEWLNSFESFYRDMGEGYKEGLQIDRIDNNRGYSKDNCRWVYRSINARNQRKRKNSTSKYKGVSLVKGKDVRPWRTLITLKSRQKHLGYYPTELEAAVAYNKEALKHDETRDYLNVIE